MRNKVVFISQGRGVIVRSLEKKVTDLGYEAVYAGLDIGKVRAAEYSMCLAVLCLEEDIGIFSDALEYLEVVMRDDSRHLVVIGERLQNINLQKDMPELEVSKYMERPVDPDAFGFEIYEIMHRKKSGRRKPNLLIVDDDPLYAKMVSEWLEEDAGVNVSVVTSGVKALAYMGRKHVDLVLLDYEMPITDGAQVLEMIRAEEELAATPVVFLTSISSRSNVEKVMSFKPAGYLLKTSPREDLLARIRSILSAEGII